MAICPGCFMNSLIEEAYEMAEKTEPDPRMRHDAAAVALSILIEDMDVDELDLLAIAIIDRARADVAEAVAEHAPIVAVH